MYKLFFPTITDIEAKLPFYLAGVGCQHEQEHIDRPNGYSHFQWIQCQKGRGRLITINGTNDVDESFGMLLYPEEPHEYYAVDNKWIVDWVLFDGCHVAEFLRNLGMTSSGIYYVSQPEILLSKIKNTMHAASSGNAMRGLDCSILVYEILISIKKYAFLSGSQSAIQQFSRLKPVFDYIDANFGNPILLHELAQIIRVTPQYLCVLFRTLLNCRVMEYINNYRIQKSKELLLASDDTKIKEISTIVGFENFSYYCSVFKEREGVSPTEFRRIHNGSEHA